MSLLRGSACLVLLVAMAGCGETPQQQKPGANRDPAAQGTGSNFVAGGWKPGDVASWNEQLRKRALHGQDEYGRTTNP
jgi:hypothetical protein